MKTRWLIFAGASLLLIIYLAAASTYMWPPIWWHGHILAANQCRENLKIIDAAKRQFAIDHHKTIGDVVTLESLKPYIKLNSHGEISQCSVGGIYTIGAIGTPPVCSFGTNKPSIIIDTETHQWDYADHWCPPN